MFLPTTSKKQRVRMYVVYVEYFYCLCYSCKERAPGSPGGTSFSLLMATRLLPPCWKLLCTLNGKEEGVWVFLLLFFFANMFTAFWCFPLLLFLLFSCFLIQLHAGFLVSRDRVWDAFICVSRGITDAYSPLIRGVYSGARCPLLRFHVLNTHILRRYF